MEKQCLVHFVYINSRIQGYYLPVLLPGKSHGLRSLVGYTSGSSKESDMTSLSLSLFIHKDTDSLKGNHKK